MSLLHIAEAVYARALARSGKKRESLAHVRGLCSCMELNDVLSVLIWDGQLDLRPSCSTPGDSISKVPVHHMPQGWVDGNKAGVDSLIVALRGD